MTTPRIQFRLSKEHDQDLIPIFENASNVTEEVKRLIRLGLHFEKIKTRHIVVSSNVKDVVQLSPLQEHFIEVTKRMKK